MQGFGHMAQHLPSVCGGGGEPISPPRTAVAELDSGALACMAAAAQLSTCHREGISLLPCPPLNHSTGPDCQHQEGSSPHPVGDHQLIGIERGHVTSSL